jgi:uncharacterized alpha-E superfamily protein
MLSRVAERCYWLARYLERAENSARLTRVYSNLLLDLPASTQLGWEVVLDIAGIEPPEAGADDKAMLTSLLSDRNNPSALLSSLAMARENARTTRDVLPTEAWRSMNELYLFARERLPKASQARQRNAVLSELVEQAQCITGLLAGTMSHGNAYQFMRLGRHLERADMTTRTIDTAAAVLLTGRSELMQFDNSLWMAVLRCLSAYQAYRQFVRRRIYSDEVIRFLVLDADFPRTVRYCAQDARVALAGLPRSEVPLQRTENFVARLASLSIDSDDAQALHQLMDDLQLEIARINESVVATWFSPDASLP